MPGNGYQIYISRYHEINILSGVAVPKHYCNLHNNEFHSIVMYYIMASSLLDICEDNIKYFTIQLHIFHAMPNMQAWENRTIVIRTITDKLCLSAFSDTKTSVLLIQPCVLLSDITNLDAMLV